MPVRIERLVWIGDADDVAQPIAELGRCLIGPLAVAIEPQLRKQRPRPARHPRPACRHQTGLPSSDRPAVIRPASRPQTGQPSPDRPAARCHLPCPDRLDLNDTN